MLFVFKWKWKFGDSAKLKASLYMSPLTARCPERQTGSSDLLTWNLARFSVVNARRGNQKKTLHVDKFSCYFVFLQPLPGDTVASEIQLSGMLLNFWRWVWRAIWKRYCSGVFHRHSDQYHQILNMGRKSLPLKNSRWKIEHWLENTRSITRDVDRKKKYLYQKWPRAWLHFNKIPTNTLPFHSIQSGWILQYTELNKDALLPAQDWEMSGDT